MTDHLALLAAKTLPCSACYKSRGKILNVYFRAIDCDICKGTRRVLDSRFEKLRKKCATPDQRGPHQHGVYTCPGYTVVRDLGVLLESVSEECVVTVSNDPKILLSMGYGKWVVRLAPHGQERSGRWYAGADTPLEAAANAVYDWVEAEEKVATND